MIMLFDRTAHAHPHPPALGQRALSVLAAARSCVTFLTLQNNHQDAPAVMPRNRDDCSGGQVVKTVTNDPTKGGDALQMLDDTWWLAYCCCAGLGCASFFEPHMCMNEQKFLCLKCQGSCDFVPFIGQEGMCLDSGKICCLMQVTRVMTLLDVHLIGEYLKQ